MVNPRVPLSGQFFANLFSTFAAIRGRLLLTQLAMIHVTESIATLLARTCSCQTTSSPQFGDGTSIVRGENGRSRLSTSAPMGTIDVLRADRE
jgi:hypothetical protein